VLSRPEDKAGDMRLLVTGSGGYIGTAPVLMLPGTGHETVGLV
jgi:nucleoside-diphosphate-sugar epimerase